MFHWTARSGVRVNSEVPRNVPIQDIYHVVQFVWSYQYTFKKVIKDWWLTR